MGHFKNQQHYETTTTQLLFFYFLTHLLTAQSSPSLQISTHPYQDVETWICIIQKQHNSLYDDDDDLKIQITPTLLLSKID